jgi:hypothetical protein
MNVPNEIFKFLTEAWDEKVARLEAERDALRFTVDTLQLEVDALQKREAERLRFQGLSRREQRQHQLHVLSDLLGQLAQLQNETRALMSAER